MIESCCIFSLNGVILFNKYFENEALLRKINKQFILKYLINIKDFKDTINFEKYNFTYKYLPKYQIIILLTYGEFFDSKNIESLMTNIEKNWVLKIDEKIIKENGFFNKIPNFLSYFIKILEKIENQNNNVIGNKPKEDNNNEIINNNLNNNVEEEEKVNNDFNPFVISSETKNEDNNKYQNNTNKEKKPKNKKKNAEGRSWDPLISNKNNNANNLNYSNENSIPNSLNNSTNKYIDSDNEEIDDNISLVSSDNEITNNISDKDSKINQKSSILSKLKTSFSKYINKNDLTDDNITPILNEFKEKLIKKNVSQKVANKICGNLKENILSKPNLEGLSLSKFVKKSLTETLVGIISPNNVKDLISAVTESKGKNKTFVIVFIGINGVGKSTNLSKVAYLLKNNGFSVMMAACDNFRSGAVEQLKVHGNNLNIPVFDKGYKDDPSNIAYEAIKEAKSKKIDVVLVDTAGRMQDNEPLMKALTKLVILNNPDQIIFIGEAISGNDVIDQLSKFNNAIYENSPDHNKREIDGIILSKFDTVDEKVGATLSLTYEVGKPIYYVGTGQKYQNLKKLNVNEVINCLLKD